MAVSTFDFEQPIVELEKQIQKLVDQAERTSEEEARLEQLQQQAEDMKREIFSHLSAWQRVQLARHLARPHALDYIHRLFSDWTELHGDRAYGDDPACLAGFASFHDTPLAVIGQQKGGDLQENIHRNYGSMHPEGYRKALRVMKLAEKFGRPVVVLIDTAGAFPGIGAEERGQAEAIARNIRDMSLLRVPIICTVIGEGGSGGALGVGSGDRLLMQENAFYSVISPEGCASILWRDAQFAERASECLRLTAADLAELGIADEIVPEPLGGAHRDPASAADHLDRAIQDHLDQLTALSVDDLLEQRFQKYRRIGLFEEET